MEQVATRSIERIIRNSVGVFCIAIWSVIGFVYWVPLLARSCAAYSGAVILAIVGRQQPNKNSAKMLDVASNFYSKGFQDIRASVFGDEHSYADSEDTTKQSSIFTSWNEFFRVLGVVGMETAIAVLFWGTIILLISHIL